MQNKDSLTNDWQQRVAEFSDEELSPEKEETLWQNMQLAQNPVASISINKKLLGIAAALIPVAFIIGYIMYQKSASSVMQNNDVVIEKVRPFSVKEQPLTIYTDTQKVSDQINTTIISGVAKRKTGLVKVNEDVQNPESVTKHNDSSIIKAVPAAAQNLSEAFVITIPKEEMTLVNKQRVIHINELEETPTKQKTASVLRIISRAVLKATVAKSDK